MRLSGVGRLAARTPRYPIRLPRHPWFSPRRDLRNHEPVAAYFLLLARDLEYLSTEKYETAAAEVGQMRRMLNRLIAKVRMEPSKTKRGTE
jgi:hypothetical protein